MIFKLVGNFIQVEDFVPDSFTLIGGCFCEDFQSLHSSVTNQCGCKVLVVQIHCDYID